VTTRTLAVVTAGLSQPSSTRLLADRIATAVSDQVRAAGDDVLVEVVELRPLARDLSDHLVTGFPSPALEAALSTVTRADALVAVTPVFTASYSGLFKSFFDVLEDGALRGKPTLLGATAGSARHSLVLEHAMRPLFAYLRALSVPTAVFAATEDFGDTSQNRLDDRIGRAAEELASILQGSVAAPAPSQDDDYLDVTPFEDLLGRDGS
jgi:FMN reductase